MTHLQNYICKAGIGEKGSDIMKYYESQGRHSPGTNVNTTAESYCQIFWFEYFQSPTAGVITAETDIRVEILNLKAAETSLQPAEKSVDGKTALQRNLTDSIIW